MPFSSSLRADRASRKRLALAGLLGLWFLTAGLDLRAGTPHFLVDAWDRENGLPSSSVTSLAQTPEGYMWIGTYNGLVRFDGERFVSFDPFNTPELLHERVRYLFTDAHGTLWINTFDGSMTTWRNGVFTLETNWPGGLADLLTVRSNRVVFVVNGSLLERMGGADEPSRWQETKLTGGISGRMAGEDANGDIWYVTSNRRLGRVRGGQSEVPDSFPGLRGRRVRCLATDPAGRLWVGTDAGLASWTGSRFQNETPGNPGRLSVSFLAFNPRGECWVFANGRLRLCRERAWVAEADEWRDLPKPYADTLSAHLDRSGNLWFCHFGRGLLCAGTNGSPEAITSADGLPGNRILCWLQDHEGNVWVGADRGGLARLRERQFQVINPGDDAASKVAMSVCEDAGGAVWIGTLGGGLTRWQDGVVTNYPLTTMDNAGFVFSVYPDREAGCLWLSADNEDLCRFENGQLSRPAWSLHGVKTMLRDRRGWLWIGMRDGLDRYADGRVEHLGAKENFQRGDVRALAEDSQGNIWVGTGGGELYQFGVSNTPAVMYRAPDRWGNQPIWSLYAEHETLWIGTFRGGLLRFRNGQFIRYSTKQGLPNDVVCQILPDWRGNLWLGTYDGIFRAARTELNAFARTGTNSISWVAYGRLAGLPSLECSGGYQPSGWQGTDGRLWFSTLKGVVSVQPNQLSNDPRVPPLLIEEVLVDGKPADLPATQAGVAAPRPLSVVIGPGKHYVEFHYTGLSFTAPEQVRFRYRLRGLDDHWVEAGTRRFAPYTFLRPGDYHFEVMACNNEGHWNPVAGTLNLRIQPHVWETWWFFLAWGLLLAGGIALAARAAGSRKFQRQMARLQQQQAVERDRARIARDIHDDLGTGLTQIGLLTELTRHAPPEALGGRLDQISATARELTGAMDEIVWAVNPQNDTLDCLAIYLCKFVQEYLSVAGLRCRLDVPVQLPARPLTAETRHNLFLAVKETLNNIVKHARATEVGLKLIPSPTGFTLLIQDNGRGFPAPGGAAPGNGRIAGGNGLTNLQKRLAFIGGRAVVNSPPGQGVLVELTVPFEPPASPQLAIPTRGSVAPSSPSSQRN